MQLITRRGKKIGVAAAILMLALIGVGYGQPVEEAKLTASDGAADDRLGHSVSLSGNRLVVGAYGNDDLGSNSGSAYVYVWDGNAWMEEAKLVASDVAAGDHFGYWVSLSGDRVLISAPWDDDKGSDSGSAYVYGWDGNAWVEEVKLTASDGAAGDNFGYKVSLLGDRVVVSSHLDDDKGNDSGSVYVYGWDGNAWVEETKLTASDGAAGDLFGYFVSLWGDRLVVSAKYDDDKGSDSGSAYVYGWDGSAWVEEAKLTASDGAAGDQFGQSVFLSGDRLLVGAFYDDDLGSNSGSAYVYGWDGNAWVEEAKLTALDGAAGDEFGIGVSIFENRAVVSSWADDDKGSNSGSAYIFSLSSAVAVQVPDMMTTYDAALTVPVQVDDTTDQDIVSAEVFLAYDGDLLTAQSVDLTGTLLVGDWAVETHIVEGNGTHVDTIKMAMATDEDVLVGAGTLINVNFQVADIRHPASSVLELTHVLLNDGTPENATTDGSVMLVGGDGSIVSVPEEIIPRWSIDVTVDDVDEDRDPGQADDFEIRVSNGLQSEVLVVAETGVSTGVFTGTIGTVFSLGSTAAGNSLDGIVQAQAGDVIVFAYADSLDGVGGTVERTDATDVIGGTDGALRVTVVSQPGDTVRVRVTDGDLSEGVWVTAANPRTGESESVVLSQFASGESHFYGRFFTGTQAGAVGDSTLEVAKGDVLSITYADTLTGTGGTASVVDDDEVVDPFGDAHANSSVQAFDAAQVLIHRLSTYGGGAGTLADLDSLSANVDQGAPFGIIDGYDASLILRKVVGLIGRFEVQEPDAVNHPQPETELRPKPVVEERALSLVPGEGYVSVWCADRAEIVSGELTLVGVRGKVAMGEELMAFLTVSQATEEGLQVVFAGSGAVSGPGELVRIVGVGLGDVRLTRASFNGGWISARWEDGVASARVPSSFTLYPNVPNPFNPKTSIGFWLPQESTVRLEVFDVVGQRVQTLATGRLMAGEHRVKWDGRDEMGGLVSSGIYFYRLRAGTFEQVRRMALLK